MYRHTNHAVCALGAAAVISTLATPSAAATNCGVSAIAARFSEAVALCGADPVRRAIPAPDAEYRGPHYTESAPVAVTMAGLATPPRQAAPAPVRATRAAPPPSGLVAAVAYRYRINPHLLASIVRAESGGRIDAVSNKGALGLMQVMPDTARGLGIRDPEALKRDPVLAMTTGAYYLKTLQARFGNRPDLVLAAYNAGPGAVAKARNRVPAYRETQSYVRTIMTNYQRSRTTTRVRR